MKNKSKSFMVGFYFGKICINIYRKTQNEICLINSTKLNEIQNYIFAMLVSLTLSQVFILSVF